MEVSRDLFGDVTTLPSGRRGRPAHRWSQSNEDKVSLALAMGYSTEDIAFGLGITPPTLRKYYFSVLKRREMQKMRFELWRMEVLAREANTGNVGAVKELGKIADRRALKLAEERLKAAAEGRDDSVPGKKEAARRAAKRRVQEPDDEWGSDLNPSLLN